jgi:hypothetical protein
MVNETVVNASLGEKLFQGGLQIGHGPMLRRVVGGLR